MSYRVRCLCNDLKCTEYIQECKDYEEAVDRFLFYVHLALEDGLNIRCCNILKGRISIKYFQNMRYGQK